ncbi:MAG TPA: hypothetical protein VLT86_09495 [Vicinamibacterales bacterium]|nr:hypothetical protein [Vicinamibacterales bacterium]
METRTARFVSADEESAVTVDDQMSESEYTSIVDDLTWALPAFDRDASRIAFQRPPGNRTPDLDPDGYSPNRFTSAGRWSPPIR